MHAKCQEYCIDNPRMKCRGAIRYTAGYAYAYGVYRDRYLCFLLRAFPYLYESYCKTRAEDETRNFDKRKSIDELKANYLGCKITWF